MSDETQQDGKPIDDEAADGVADGAGDGKILSDNEVDALLEGVASGEIEICSSQGRQIASLREFVVPARSRLVSKRLPNLERLVDRMADRIRVRVRQDMGCPAVVTRRECVELAYEAMPERRLDPVVAVQFSAPPLAGRGALLLERELLDQLVECYFGGTSAGRSAARGNGFTTGELRVADQLAALVIESLQSVWEPLQAIEPAVDKVEPGAQLLDIAADADPVLRSTVDFRFDEQDSAMHLLLPSAMIAASLPYLRGIDRDEDPARDKHWRDVITAGLQEIDVGIEATVGDVSMTLAELICLQPGDVIPIENPRQATLHAGGIPLISGRFGLHAGHNAVEATAWLKH